LSIDGKYAPAVKHWLAQPAVVRHCGNDPQSRIALWQGQSDGLAAFISAVIVHGFAMATLAIGAKAEASDSNITMRVRNEGMGSCEVRCRYLGQVGANSSERMGAFVS
jgi:hypothetical protein